MSIRIDERGRGHVESRPVRGPIAVIGLVVVIAIIATIAFLIHRDNLSARDQARRAAEAADAPQPR